MSSSGAAQSSVAPASTGQSSKWLFIVAAVGSGISALTLVINLIYTAASVGSSDSWATIKGKITGILVTSLIGGFIFSIALTLLMIARPSLTAWVPALISALALSIAVAAVSVAAISR